ncbi:MAG TPA: DUF1570 domain-containing protein [Pirellulales bacterium]|jgi:hypothetical protein|nr:DUF1570 domain-containing protein [Pirellulales bacterium]
MRSIKACCWFVLLTACLAATVRGQERSAAPRSNGEWLFERVTLTDGKSYQGLVQTDGRTVVEFLEVRRPPGKPMSLVVRPIERKAISKLERLKPAEREELSRKLQAYKSRAVIEGRSRDDLTLTEAEHDGTHVWRFEGRLFTLESTADEQMTRRVIVRLGQIFTAYRQVLAPRRRSETPIEIRIFGAGQEYRAALVTLGVAVANPAVYLPESNAILAGSELNRFAAELAAVQHEHQRIKGQLDAEMAEVPGRIKQLGADLKDAGLPAAERMKILVAEGKKWDDHRKNIRRKIGVIDRKNAARFDEVSARMFERLAHEAFHAYLELYVYPRDSYDVPRWLNEGLAQTFEAGLLEAESLRIDAPNPRALAELQNDLRGERPLALAELLNAGPQTFLTAEGNERAAPQYYAYSWGLAYYLAFDQNVLESAAFEQYLTASAGMPAVERFEQFVGRPLPDFESKWRAAMLALRAAQ